MYTSLPIAPHRSVDTARASEGRLATARQPWRHRRVDAAPRPLAPRSRRSDDEPGKPSPVSPFETTLEMIKKFLGTTPHRGQSTSTATLVHDHIHTSW